MEHAPIVVLLDAGADAIEAVRWAAWQSQETSTPLEVAHCYAAPVRTGSDPRLELAEESYRRARATRWLHQALDESAAIPFHLRLVVAAGSVEEVLGPLLRPAGLLVLGSGTPASLIAWSSRQRRCPVVLVPGPGHAAPTAPDLGTYDPVSAQRAEIASS